MVNAKEKIERHSFLIRGFECISEEDLHKLGHGWIDDHHFVTAKTSNILVKPDNLDGLKPTHLITIEPDKEKNGTLIKQLNHLHKNQHLLKKNEYRIHYGVDVMEDGTKFIRSRNITLSIAPNKEEVKKREELNSLYKGMSDFGVF